MREKEKTTEVERLARALISELEDGRQVDDATRRKLVTLLEHGPSSSPVAPVSKIKSESKNVFSDQQLQTKLFDQMQAFHASRFGRPQDEHFEGLDRKDAETAKVALRVIEANLPTWDLSTLSRMSEFFLHFDEAVGGSYAGFRQTREIEYVKFRLALIDKLLSFRVPTDKTGIQEFVGLFAWVTGSEYPSDLTNIIVFGKAYDPQVFHQVFPRIRQTLVELKTRLEVEAVQSQTAKRT